MHQTRSAQRAGSDRDSVRRALEDLREQIDGIDDALLALIERRLAAARAVAALKSSRGDDHLWMRPRREQEVIARLTARASVASPALVEQLWREIMAFSLQEQVRTELVLHGPEPTALRAAAKRRFGSAAPMRLAATAAEALRAARSEEAVAVIALDDGAEWIERLDPILSIFDWIRDEKGEPVAAAVGRVPPEELPDHPALRGEEAGR